MNDRDDDLAPSSNRKKIMIKRKEIIGDATLYLGDSYLIAPTLGVFDCMVTDPTYEIKTSGGGKFRKERTYLEGISDSKLDVGFDFKIINTLLYGSVIVFCHNDQAGKLITYLEGSYRRIALCAWHKINPIPMANKHYLPDTELYIHAWNDGFHPQGEHKDKKRYIETKNGKSDFDHPTVKPSDVMNKIMINASGQTIIDPFMGTGSTGVSALKFGKKFTGIEVNEKYFDIACKRIEGELNAKSKSPD